MKGFLAVLQREFAEQRRVLAAAGFVSLWPFLMPVLFAGLNEPPSTLRAGSALAFSTVLTACLALMLGSSVLARDLAERRLGFYFARPIPGWAVWSGKLAGAALLIFASGALVLLPTLLIGDRLDADALPFGILGLAALPLTWAGMLLFLLLAAHALGTMLRSRSLWLALDLAAGSLITVLALSLRDRLLFEGVGAWWRRGLLWLPAVLLFILLAATAVQIVQGRSDLRRGHRRLSLTLWGLLLGASLTVSVAAARLLQVSPADLVQIQHVAPAPAGRWISLSGPAGRSFHGLELQSHFVLDTASGRSFRVRVPGVMPLGTSLWWIPHFSTDGRWVVWQEIGDFPPNLTRLDLTNPGAEPLRIPASGLIRAAALSPDGQRLALLQKDRLLLEETGTGRLIASFPQPPGGSRFDREAVRFLESGRLRLYRVQPSRENGKRVERMAISEVDPVTRRTEQTGILPKGAFLFASPLISSPDGERLLLASYAIGQVFDSRTGALLSELAPRQGHCETTFLADGRIAQILVASTGSDLRIYDRDGVAEVRRFSLPRARTISLGGQPTPGLVAVGVHSGNPFMEPAGWRSLLLDLETGRLQELGKGLFPAGDPALPPGSFGSSLFVRDGNRLVSIDPKTGRETAIAIGS